MFQNPHVNFPLLIVIGTITFIVFVMGFFFVIRGYQKRVFSNFSEKQELQSRYKQELLQTQIEIQEQTLLKISQEIHDNIGQVLSLAKLNVNAMKGANPGAMDGIIDESIRLIGRAIQDLRDLSKSMHSDYITQMGLVQSLEYELEQIKKTGTCAIHFYTQGRIFRLGKQQELIIFRIVQEALHNIIKHAGASEIKVNILFSEQEFKLEVNDNGIGFNTAQLIMDNYEGLGLGIRNMYNRARMINTVFTITSFANEGTTVMLTLPLQDTKF